MSITKVIQWNAAIYLRLSKEDGDKAESNSISNQRDLITTFVKSFSDVQIRAEHIDDGYSGADFDRPSFQKMIEEIKEGKINCVIVKDLSRFGRNWIETGKYLDKIFPFLGVRFIAINDQVDSVRERTTNDQLIIPFKNLLNDSFLSDISRKVKSQLEVKRKNGEFIGAFCPFGYKKDSANKNKIIIDPVAAEVVQEIFRLKIEGFSQQNIAKRLNRKEISSPMEYKLENGENFTTSFKTKHKVLWSVVSINRILRNEIYIGNLIQGKRTVENFKIKKVVQKDASDWTCVESTHEPIISKSDFLLVDALLKKDLRKSPSEDTVYFFAGLLYCADCKQSMIRKQVTSKGKKYVYYVCSTHKNEKRCSSHTIRDQGLEKAVLRALQVQVKTVVTVEQLLQYVEKTKIKQFDLERIETLLQKKQIVLEKLKQRKVRL